MINDDHHEEKERAGVQSPPCSARRRSRRGERVVRKRPGRIPRQRTDHVNDDGVVSFIPIFLGVSQAILQTDELCEEDKYIATAPPFVTLPHFNDVPNFQTTGLPAASEVDIEAPSWEGYRMLPADSGNRRSLND